MNEMIKKELIGCDIKVGNNTGKIIDETKNMVIIETEDGKRKKFIKKNHFFEIVIDGETVKIDGKELLLRPEERIKVR